LLCDPCAYIESRVSQVPWDRAESICQTTTSRPSAYGTSACRSRGHFRDRGCNKTRFLAPGPVRCGLQESLSRGTVRYPSTLRCERQRIQCRQQIPSTPAQQHRKRVASFLTSGCPADAVAKERAESFDGDLHSASPRR
jgi:hypothetical protein